MVEEAEGIVEIGKAAWIVAGIAIPLAFCALLGACFFSLRKGRDDIDKLKLQRYLIERGRSEGSCPME